MSDPKDRSKGGTESVRDGATRLEDFRLMCKLGEGTFSEVLKVKHKKSGRIYAMKRFRKTFSTFEEVEGLREIQALRRLNPHQHIIDLEDVVFEPKHGILSLNFELMDCNLYELISKKQVNITEQRAKGYMLQICRGLEYMHSKGIFHRDIKPENILIKDHTIKIADFGSCRGIHSKPPYTEYIATRWYRAPECLLCDGMYSYKMDLWAVGCVLYELITGAPLFPGINEVDQIHRIHNVLGTPSQKVLKSMMGSRSSSLKFQFPPKEGTGIRALLPQFSSECHDIIIAMLAYNPDDRITARESLKHQFFRDIHVVHTFPTPNEGTTSKAGAGKDEGKDTLPALPSTYLKQPKNPPKQQTHADPNPPHTQQPPHYHQQPHQQLHHASKDTSNHQHSDSSTHSTLPTASLASSSTAAATTNSHNASGAVSTSTNPTFRRSKKLQNSLSNSSQQAQQQQQQQQQTQTHQPNKAPSGRRRNVGPIVGGVGPPGGNTAGGGGQASSLAASGMPSIVQASGGGFQVSGKGSHLAGVGVGGGAAAAGAGAAAGSSSTKKLPSINAAGGVTVSGSQNPYAHTSVTGATVTLAGAPQSGAVTNVAAASLSLPTAAQAQQQQQQPAPQATQTTQPLQQPGGAPSSSKDPTGLPSIATGGGVSANVAPPKAVKESLPLLPSLPEKVIAASTGSISGQLNKFGADGAGGGGSGVARLAAAAADPPQSGSGAGGALPSIVPGGK